MAFERIRLELDQGTALLTVDRPEVRNALDADTVTEIHGALDRIEAEGSTRVLIVTGAGEKVFVAGADVNSLLARSARDTLDANNNRLFSRLENVAYPTIAAVNGFALGGGLEFALACDLRVASENAKLGLPETSLGIIPGAGGTHRLPRLVGLGLAKEMILAGTILDADAALRSGLVNRVVPSGELLDTARELARQIKKRAPLATELAKVSLNSAGNIPVEYGMAFDRVAQTVLNASHDKKEGMTAFLEKRKPEFRGD
ncbi:MAG: enoyl-CoA hydratase/isomerase family protein [Gemmatimonadetes bacterium]|nr:enoyl-CoA hydratase/isomerase family protein [Gemmatimonadota bacterium]